MATIGRDELVKDVSGQTGYTQKEIIIIMNKLLDAIVLRLRNGDDIMIQSFGKFSVTDMPAREGRNPTTGEAIHIAASRNIRFRAAKPVRDMFKRDSVPDAPPHDPVGAGILAAEKAMRDPSRLRKR